MSPNSFLTFVLLKGGVTESLVPVSWGDSGGDSGCVVAAKRRFRDQGSAAPPDNSGGRCPEDGDEYAQPRRVQSMSILFIILG